MRSGFSGVALAMLLAPTLALVAMGLWLPMT